MKKHIDRRLQKINNALTKELFQTIAPIFLLVVVACVIAYKLIESTAPPKKIVIALSTQSANEKVYASIYNALLQKDGIRLEIKETSGDVENIELLKDSSSSVDLAFVQDGVTRSQGAGNLQSLGSLYYEPVWIICRCETSINHLAGFRGKRIAISQKGEGANLLELKLLQESGLNHDNTKLLPFSSESAVDALIAGKVDVAILVDSIESASVKRALSQKDLHLVSLDDAEAYSKHFSYLHHLKLAEGAIDIKRNIPPTNVSLISPTVTLVGSKNLHPALIYLMMKVITQVHRSEGLLNANNEFPSIKTSEISPSSQALNFYKSGTPFIDKYLPFWAATFVSRALIVVLPILAVLIPLIRLIPSIYNWFLKFRLFRYYGELRFLEMQLKTDTGMKNEDLRQKLDDIEERVRDINMPISFSQYIYELRANIQLVRSKLK